MKIAGSLVVLLTLVLGVNLCADWWVRSPDDDAMRAALSVGLLMLGGWLTGRLFESFKQPRITGYMVLGMLVGPSLLNLVPGSQILSGGAADTAPLQTIIDLAVALIALTAGGEIHLPWLRGRLRQIAVILLIHVVVLFVAVAGLMLLARPWLGFLRETGMAEAIVIAVLAGVVMVAKSPAVTVAMISDYRASGRMTQMTLVVTVFKDLLLIVVFSTVMAVSQGVLGAGGAVSPGFALALGVELIGSIVLGGLVGLAMAWYVGRVAAHMGIFVLGTCLALAVIGEQHFAVAGHAAHLEPLLMALAAGLVMRNVWAGRAERFFQTVAAMSLPVYCLFFAIAGARIDLKVFATLWPLSLALVAVRAAATWAGVELSLALIGQRRGEMRLMWLGFVSQAGVSLVLVTLIAKAFGGPASSGWAGPLADVLVGAIFVNQLLGPIGFRHALLRSGEGRAGPLPSGRSAADFIRRMTPRNA